MSIRDLVEKFETKRNANARYASFDYCFNYFQSFTNKGDLASSANLHMSSLQVGFFLASWGMFRNSSLMERSVRHYEPLIGYFAKPECKLWNVHPKDYLEPATQSILLEGYDKIGKLMFPKGGRDMVAVTKVMLGVFGCFPALDDFFRFGMPRLLSTPGSCKFSTLGPKAIRALGCFYRSNAQIIEELGAEILTLAGDSEFPANRPYTAAKIIDMMGFQEGAMNHPRATKKAARLKAKKAHG